MTGKVWWVWCIHVLSGSSDIWDSNVHLQSFLINKQKLYLHSVFITGTQRTKRVEGFIFLVKTFAKPHFLYFNLSALMFLASSLPRHYISIRTSPAVKLKAGMWITSPAPWKMESISATAPHIACCTSVQLDGSITAHDALRHPPMSGFRETGPYFMKKKCQFFLWCRPVALPQPCDLQSFLKAHDKLALLALLADCCHRTFKPPGGGQWQRWRDWRRRWWRK